MIKYESLHLEEQFKQLIVDFTSAVILVLQGILLDICFFLSASYFDTLLSVSIETKRTRTKREKKLKRCVFDEIAIQLSSKIYSNKFKFGETFST